MGGSQNVRGITELLRNPKFQNVKTTKCHNDKTPTLKMSALKILIGGNFKLKNFIILRISIRGVEIFESGNFSLGLKY